MSSTRNPMGMFASSREEIEKSLGSTAPVVSGDNLEIHTMKSEIEDMKSGKSRAANGTLETQPEKTVPLEAKSNPFFSQPNQQDIPAPIQTKSTPTNPISESFRPEAGTPNESHASETPKKISSFRRIAGPVVLALLLLAGGGFYFWNSTKNSDQSDTETPSANVPETVASNESTEASSEATAVSADALSGSFSQDNPNYLPLESVPAKDSQTVYAYAKKVAENGYDAPVEFIPTDGQNNPLTLDSFLSDMQITLPAAVRASLGTDYSLFLYGDNGNPRIGIAISCPNEAKTALELSKEEPSLVKYFRPLYLGSNVPAVGGFASSSYEGTGIRYVNLTQGNDSLSLDYAIRSGKLLIGTSKDTLRATLDKLQ